MMGDVMEQVSLIAGQLGVGLGDGLTAAVLLMQLYTNGKVSDLKIYVHENFQRKRNDG